MEEAHRITGDSRVKALVAHPSAFGISKGAVFLPPFFQFLFSILYLHRGPELARGEIFQSAEASVEFRGREAPLAVERAQEIRGRLVILAEVAFHAAGNQIAEGIAAEAHAWHNVVEALHVSGSAAEAVKAGAAFAIVNGLAERPGFEEIGGVEFGCRRFLRGPGAAIEEVASGPSKLAVNE
jgi:hypothetical protein